jgi:HEAT repeat protein
MKRFSLLLIVCACSTPAHAYIEGQTPTLGKLTNDAVHIVVLQVDKVNLEKRVIIFNKIADLKGKDPQVQVKHQITDGAIHPEQAHAILDWAEPGKIAVCFHNEKVCQTCVGTNWYQCSAMEAPWWSMTWGSPELAYSYSGSTAKLREHVAQILAGREVIVTALKYDGRYRWETFEAVCSGRSMRGKEWPLWRLRASLTLKDSITMPATYNELKPRLVVGAGAAGPDDVPALLKALKHDDANVRIEAAQDLALTDPPALTAVPALLAAFRDPEPRVRIAAAEAVASIDPKNQEALPLLVKALADEAVRVRKAAAISLGNLGAGAKVAVGDLAKSLQDKDPSVRWAVADALGEMGPDAALAVAALTDALPDKAIRVPAIHALGQIGLKAQTAIPVLTPLLKEDDTAVRWAVASALVRIGGPGLQTGVHTLCQIATSDKTTLGRGIYQAANVVNASRHPETLRFLLQAVRDPDARELPSAMYFGDAFRTLYTRRGKDDLPALKKCLQDPDPGVRSMTAAMLVRAREMDVKEHIAMQVQTLKAADPWVRRFSARVMLCAAVDPASRDAREAVAALTAALADQDASVRAAAVEALRQISKK